MEEEKPETVENRVPPELRSDRRKSAVIGFVALVLLFGAVGLVNHVSSENKQHFCRAAQPFNDYPSAPTDAQLHADWLKIHGSGACTYDLEWWIDDPSKPHQEFLYDGQTSSPFGPSYAK